jgi:peptide-methionine (S)-S-oxide reductase
MNASPRETATLAGGCFWCLEAVFKPLKGVDRVLSGYTGGVAGRPTYEEVCTGTTGHAEAVQVTFDPAVLDYRELLELFFAFHDPTTLNRQDADVGTQYRSAVFYHDDAQRREADRAIAELETAGTWDGKIVTDVVPLSAFYAAEEDHRDYFRRNPGQAYCRAVVAPKLAKARKAFFERLKR